MKRYLEIESCFNQKWCRQRRNREYFTGEAKCWNDVERDCPLPTLPTLSKLLAPLKKKLEENKRAVEQEFLNKNDEYYHGIYDGYCEVLQVLDEFCEEE